MAALAGDHVIVKLDDSGGTLRTFDAGDITSVDLGLSFTQYEVTGFGDAVHNFINGQLQAPVTLKGYLTTTANTGTHTVINGAFQAGTKVTLVVQVGNNTTPTTGDPEYEGEFFIESYTPTIESGGAVMFTATLKPARPGGGQSEPQWGTRHVKEGEGNSPSLFRGDSHNTGENSKHKSKNTSP